MKLLSPSKNRTRLIAGVAGLIATSLILAGCGKTAANPSPTPATSDTSLTNPAGGPVGAAQTPTTPGASPTMMKATTTTQAVTNEGAQLNAVNKDATSIDQSLNDQAGSVN